MDKDITDRLREAAGFALMDAARETVVEAAGEIEKLRGRLRLADAAVRSGDCSGMADEIDRLRKIVAMWERCAVLTREAFGNCICPKEYP